MSEIKGSVAATAEEVEALDATCAGMVEPEPKRNSRGKFFSVGLHGADEGSAMRIHATRHADGTAVSFVVWTTTKGGKKQHTRGATEHHDSMEAAKAAVAKLASQAMKLGWSRKASGFKTKPDAFDAGHLPSAKAKR
jgi:hypothetical protein